MKKIIAIIAFASLIACSTTKTTTHVTSGTNTEGLAFDPAPPKQGVETLTVTVNDQTGAPLKGAKVTIATQMRAMSMTGPILIAKDNGEGTYSATINLNYATQWTFVVAVAYAGKTERAEFTQDVK